MQKQILTKRKNLKEKKERLHTKLMKLNIPLDQIEAITKLNLEELLEAINSQRYSSLDVLRAYQLKALKMDETLNFIIDLNDNAELDLENSSNSPYDTLRGVPVSIKDTYFVKGCDCTFGLVRFANSPAQNDSVLVALLREHGAIPFVITNMCQTGFSIESSNPLLGETKNPYDLSRTCGGSSGGEGAILGSGASILGIGSDYGGSVRIPAHYCGLYTLKPTSTRLSFRNIRSCGPDSNLISVSNGPMARELNDLVYMYKCLVSETLHQLDPNCPNIPFNNEVYQSRKPLKIGYYINLGDLQVQPIPAVERAVLEAKSALEKCGHTMVKFQLPKIDYAFFNLYLKSLFPDGGNSFVKYQIGMDTLDSTLSLTYYILKTPKIFKRIMSWILWPINGAYSKMFESMMGCKNIPDLYILHDDLYAYHELVLEYLEGLELDAWICPTFPVTAPLLGTSDNMLDIINYTAIYNLLDYPASVIPTTKVTEQDVNKLKADYPTDTPTHREIKKNQVDTIGMSIGVQCVSFKWQEEICLRVMKDIYNNLS